VGEIVVIDSVPVEIIDVGIVNGLQTFVVVNTETGKTIGYNQTAVEETE
jgi:hypothetical protein